MDAQAMMDFGFTRHDLFNFLLSSGAWLTAGALIGTFQFLTLQWSVRMLVAGRGLLLSVGVQLARFAMIAFILTAIVRSSGAFSLLVAAAGIVVARTLMVQRSSQL
jgi:F1F0 ATPase subunit 2